MDLRLRGAGVAALVPVWCAASVSGAIVSASNLGDLETAMGATVPAVVDDGNPVGTVYGNPPTFTPGISLTTPFGPMGFEPSHDRTEAGTAGYSGAFHALTTGGPIAGSDVVPPVGATAIGFYIIAEAGSAHDFEITAVGTSSTKTILVPGINEYGAVWVSFGAFGETLIDVSIVKLPKFTATPLTWEVFDIHVLPSPGTVMVMMPIAIVTGRRRR